MNMNIAPRTIDPDHLTGLLTDFNCYIDYWARDLRVLRDDRPGDTKEEKRAFGHWTERITTGHVDVEVLADDESEWRRLDRNAVLAAIDIIADRHNYHCGTKFAWADVLTDPDFDFDACVGDMFVQYCLFGEVVYG